MVRLDGAAGPVPVTAPMAVVAGWLDDQPAHSPAAAPETPDPRPAWADGAPASGRTTAGRSQGEGVVSGHAAARRPWALSPPQQVDDLGRGERDRVLLEVRLLDDRLGDRLLRSCRPGTPVRFGRWPLAVAGEPELLEHADWGALGRGTSERAWLLRVISPATFRSRNRTSPWADPVAVARGLHQRWQLLHPSTAPDAVDGGARSVWVSDFDGRSEVTRLRGQVVSGFVGRLRYVADGPRAEAEAFSALMGFAAFAGIGSHTTYGFGTVVPEGTWQPPSARPRP
jgi:CRISPR-associated endoribonuclease Cas6